MSSPLLELEQIGPPPRHYEFSYGDGHSPNVGDITCARGLALTANQPLEDRSDRGNSSPSPSLVDWQAEEWDNSAVILRDEYTQALEQKEYEAYSLQCDLDRRETVHFRSRELLSQENSLLVRSKKLCENLTKEILFLEQWQEHLPLSGMQDEQKTERKQEPCTIEESRWIFDDMDLYELQNKTSKIIASVGDAAEFKALAQKVLDRLDGLPAESATEQGNFRHLLGNCLDGIIRSVSASKIPEITSSVSDCPTSHSALRENLKNSRQAFEQSLESLGEEMVDKRVELVLSLSRMLLTFNSEKISTIFSPEEIDYLDIRNIESDTKNPTTGHAESPESDITSNFPFHSTKTDLTNLAVLRPKHPPVLTTERQIRGILRSSDSNNPKPRPPLSWGMKTVEAIPPRGELDDYYLGGDNYPSQQLPLCEDETETDEEKIARENAKSLREGCGSSKGAHSYENCVDGRLLSLKSMGNDLISVHRKPNFFQNLAIRRADRENSLSPASGVEYCEKEIETVEEGGSSVDAL